MIGDTRKRGCTITGTGTMIRAADGSLARTRSGSLAGSTFINTRRTQRRGLTHLDSHDADVHVALSHTVINRVPDHLAIRVTTSFRIVGPKRTKLTVTAIVKLLRSSFHKTPPTRRSATVRMRDAMQWLLQAKTPGLLVSRSSLTTRHKTCVLPESRMIAAACLEEGV